MLSVIVASQNDEQYIAYTLDAVINAYNEYNIDLECIIIDKGSTDETRAICENYCKINDFIRLIPIENDGKVLATAFNIGIQEAQGDTIVFYEAGFAPNPAFLKDASLWLEAEKDGRCAFISPYFSVWRNGQPEMYTSYWTTDAYYGPNLSTCIFLKDCIRNTQFENIPFSGSIFAMWVIKYNFHYFGRYLLNSDDLDFAYTQFRQDEHDIVYNKHCGEEFSDILYTHVKYLQYMPADHGYKFCLDSNNILIDRGNRPIWNMDYHIIDKCNLNCKYCNHFCPIVPNDTQPKPLEQVYKDLENIARYKDMISNFTILGGEPLLHPDLGKILIKARELMPNNLIMLTTNGTLYHKLEGLWQIIRDNNISVQLSLYPVANTNEIQEAFNRYIRAQNLQYSAIPTEFGFCKRLLQEDIQNDTELLLACPRRRCCTQYAGGRLYICHYAAGLHYLKAKFNDVKINDDGYIEIKQDTKPGEIIKFLYTAIPDVCRHCNDVTMYNKEANEYNWDCDPWTTSTYQLDEFYRR